MSACRNDYLTYKHRGNCRNTIMNPKKGKEALKNFKVIISLENFL